MPFLDDGYTLEATIAATDESPAFDITYRPMLRGERQRLAIGTARASESGDNDRMLEWETRTLEALAKLLKSWTLKDRSGKAVKISVDALRRIDDSRQFEQIYDLVAGYAKPPADGEDSAEATDEKN